jgi:hypothetical protein
MTLIHEHPSIKTRENKLLFAEQTTPYEPEVGEVFSIEEWIAMDARNQQALADKEAAEDAAFLATKPRRHLLGRRGIFAARS